MSAILDTVAPGDPLPETDPTAPQRDRAPAPRWAGPVAGLLAAAAALGVGWLVAAGFDALGPLDAVGSEFIDRTPAWLKQLAIDWFGTANKTALRVGMVVVIAVLAALAGALARQRRWIGPAAMAVFGALGAVIAAGRPGEGAAAAVAALVAAAMGALAIWGLTALVSAGDPPRERPGASQAPDGWDRRRFVAAGAGTAAVAVGASFAARLVERRRADDARDDAPALPQVDSATLSPGDVASAAPEVPADATLSPVSPFITPIADFYRIDTAFSIPRVRVDQWALDIGGMVERPLRLTYADLLARPQVERHVTIACVSNEVGGNLVGTATWQGVLLADLLDEAGVQPGAEQVFGTSVDGWTCGFPVAAATDGRDAMIAVGMNGEPLPVRHGFPARVIVPGLYGYVSATKWLARLDLTTWDAEEGYWIPRGWAREAPIKTQSRIDVPRRGETVKAGTVAIAGVAWAQRRGVTRVEVRIDDGPWTEARLGSDVSTDTWRQWVLEWQAEPGEHVIQVRATDGSGEVQTDEVARPDPDGATGHHSRRVVVDA
jgi:DMSO/TMAO reductase YedYZ molybdopterin-dependent catalytic subunit